MKNRLLSLDVLRGLTMILMTVVNNPGDWGHVYAPLLHAEWHGCTPTDLVFPTFLFIVGITTVLATPVKTLNKVALQKLITRGLRIFCLGLFLSFFSKIHFLDWEGIPLLSFRLVITLVVAYALFGNYNKTTQLYVAVAVFLIMMVLAFGGFKDFETVRIPGVLQRIAIVYLIITLIYLSTGLTVQLGIATVLLIVYWLLMTYIPVPGFGEANLEKGTNLAAWLDNRLLGGHLWVTSKTWDPEGILSTLPAIATGILGLWTGSILVSNRTIGQKFTFLFVMAVSGIAAGWLWGLSFPVNKALWTSSYVLYAAGWALLCFTLFYYIIDIRGWKRFTQPFVAFGVNPMIVFFLSGIIPRVWNVIKIQVTGTAGEMVGMKEYWYKYILSPRFSNPMNASLADALIYLLFWYVIVSILYRNRIIIKV
ncbi:hypothetical protein DYBT9275_03601 [Dyadobacter sp. CECT 9275]|uniref:DUF5009 domain-containing protein n=1 Tax=Dyadobacter helix TaxID=2822344 RepID=A0A916JDU3_9BACT|nr:DUF5009 domain-containing protein [Dyadobacter sp. CECT 9275]CAG5005539.1 hypothetical protein DYBT9275_03601 [Dyadobacter sp. CECT 9275]